MLKNIIFNVSYNLKLAQIFGVNSSILIGLFFNQLINIKNLYKDKYLILDRNKIFELTGVDIKTQKQVEESLIECKIMEIVNFDNINYYYINEQLLNNIIFNNLDIPKVSIKRINKESKELKKETIKNKLKLNIKELDEELKNKYYQWIDSLYEKGNILSKIGVNVTQEKLSIYNKKEKIEILNIAIINSWKDISFAIERFIKTNKNNSNEENKQQLKLSEEDKIKNGLELKNKLNKGEEVF